jgi:transposase
MPEYIKPKQSWKEFRTGKKEDCICFFFPPYSPHLNIAETLWRKLKKEWLDPPDYIYKDALAYAIDRCLADMGKGQKINFSHFNKPN